MKAAYIKFIVFSLGMSAAIASSIISILVLMLSITGRTSIVYEQNPLLAFTEILLLIFSVATCIISTEIYQKYQEKNNSQKTKTTC